MVVKLTRQQQRTCICFVTKNVLVLMGIIKTSTILVKKSNIYLKTDEVMCIS